MDVFRGLAIGLMLVYHFAFDLNYFGRLRIDFNHDPLWLSFRAVIVAMFLALVGVSLHLATAQGLDLRRYLRRLAVLVFCAALVSAASYALFPRSFIYFGILHFIAVASVLGLFMTRFFWTNLAAGLALVAAGIAVSHPLFDRPALGWIGLMTHKPITEDYVPLLPWFGVVLIGLFLGKVLYREPLSRVALWCSPRPWWRGMAFGGRHSLVIYMVHQPIFFGVLFLLYGD